MKRRHYLGVGLACMGLCGLGALFAFRHRLLARLRPRRTVDDVLEAFGSEETSRLANGSPLALLAFKEERRLELWRRDEGAWSRLKRWPFTAFSGKLGPKLREGDRQIPEGIYEIEYLNPNSSYHLSMKVNYPNAFDRAQAEREGRTHLGGDIFIHGKAVTIGCIPIGDDAMEELFTIVARHRKIASGGDEAVRVIIAPRDLRERAPPMFPEIPWTPEKYERVRQALEAFPVGV